jgi:hypothetical protein
MKPHDHHFEHVETLYEGHHRIEYKVKCIICGEEDEVWLDKDEKYYRP